MKTTNYYNTFIAVAPDCPVNKAEVPPLKETAKTIANLQFEMIGSHPYKYTSDEVLFAIHALRSNLRKEELSEAKKLFFSKGQACLRASPLAKRYGWGIHSNEEGKVAIYALESARYKELLNDKKLKHLQAMRSKHAA